MSLTLGPPEILAAAIFILGIAIAFAIIITEERCKVAELERVIAKMEEPKNRVAPLPGSTEVGV